MSRFAPIRKQLHGYVWAPNLSALPAWRARWLWTLRFAHVLVMEIVSGRLSLRATSLVYTTLLSLVPMLAVSFSMLKAFGIHRQFEPFLMDFFNPLGDKGHELAMQIMSFVNNLKVGVLGVVGLVLVIYTGVSLLSKAEEAFNDIWCVDRSRSVLRKFTDYLSVLLVGPVLIVAAISLSAAAMNTDVARAVVGFGFIGYFGAKLLPYVLVIIAFSFAYMFIPNTRVRLNAALIGGVIAGCFWHWAGAAFTALVVQSTTYAAVYSSFAILILFFVWLHVSWVIVLFGAVIAYYAQNPDAVVLGSEGGERDSITNERIFIIVMYLIGRAFYRGEKALTARELARLCGVDSARLLHVLHTLCEDEWITTVGDDPPRYVPARALEKIDIAALWKIATLGRATVHAATDQTPDVTALLGEIDAAVATGMRGKSLRDLYVVPSNVKNAP